jgi:hypothetical protein
MPDFPHLRQFLASWFVDADEAGGDEAAAGRFAAVSEATAVQAVLDEAHELASGSDESLMALIDTEANRFFDAPAGARVWLERICEVLEQEMGGNPS